MVKDGCGEANGIELVLVQMADRQRPSSPDIETLHANPRDERFLRDRRARIVPGHGIFSGSKVQASVDDFCSLELDVSPVAR